MGRENEEAWARWSSDSVKRELHAADSGNELLRFKRLRFIREHIGEEVVRNDPVVASGLAAMDQSGMDVDQGMALLCRELSNGMRRVLSMLVDASFRNPAPVVIHGVGMSAKAADSFEPGDIAYWNENFELVKHRKDDDRS